MNRKHNPLVAVVALLLLAVILLCTSCSTPAKAEEPENSPRFIIDQQSQDPVFRAYIITDTETGVQYLMMKCGQGIGLTVLQPAPETEEAQANE